MAHLQTHSSSHSTGPNTASVTNILPATTLMPLSCDECDIEEEYEMKTLRALPQLTCTHCQAQRQFSAFELGILESTLKNLGYYFSR